MSGTVPLEKEYTKERGGPGNSIITIGPREKNTSAPNDIATYLKNSPVDFLDSTSTFTAKKMTEERAIYSQAKERTLGFITHLFGKYFPEPKTSEQTIQDFAARIPSEDNVFIVLDKRYQGLTQLKALNKHHLEIRTAPYVPLKLSEQLFYHEIFHFFTPITFKYSQQRNRFELIRHGFDTYNQEDQKSRGFDTEASAELFSLACAIHNKETHFYPSVTYARETALMLTILEEIAKSKGITIKEALNQYLYKNLTSNPTWLKDIVNARQHADSARGTPRYTRDRLKELFRFERKPYTVFDPQTQQFIHDRDAVNRVEYLALSLFNTAPESAETYRQYANALTNFNVTEEFTKKFQENFGIELAFKST